MMNMNDFAERFDEYYINQLMKKNNINRKLAKENLSKLKKFDHHTYEKELNEWFDSIHPY